MAKKTYSKEQIAAFQKAYDSRVKALTHQTARKIKVGRILEFIQPSRPPKRCIVIRNEVRVDGHFKVLCEDASVYGSDFVHYDQVVKVFEANAFDLLKDNEVTTLV